MKNILLILFYLLLQINAGAQIGAIFTVAGNGTAGYTGDSGFATSATLSFPDAIVIDPAGNIYISDRDNHVIRKVDVNQIITTFAGNSFPGIEGDGGLAINAEFSAPYGITVDKAGNVYISDEYIRKIDVNTGIITNYAGGGTNRQGDGGPATLAEMEGSHQIVFDTAGNLYITDESNFSIRKVDTAGIITTIAGNGTQGCTGDGGAATAAELSMPAGVAIDAGGNIFIGDFQNHNIRRVDAVTGLISTVCGDPDGNDAGISGDGGPAHLAELMTSTGLTFDSRGNLYICDNQGQEIREITTDGVIHTIAGEGMNAQPPFSDSDGVAATADMLKGPYGIAFDKEGSLYIAEADNYKVRKIVYESTGIQSIGDDIQLTCYPNPVSDVLNVESTGLNGAKISSSVYNVTGQLISLPCEMVGNKLKFETGNLSPGMYYINLITSVGTGSIRFVKE